MRSQRGLSLVEISLSLALVGLTTAMVARNVERNSQQLLAQAEAQTLLAVQKGLQGYLNEYAIQLVEQPNQPVERTVRVSETTSETITLPAGTQVDHSYWPSLEKLRQLQFLPSSINLQSLTASGRSFVSGPIQVYANAGDETPLPSAEFCLRDGCILRISAYPDPGADAISSAGPAARTANLIAHLMRQLGIHALLAESNDGWLYSKRLWLGGTWGHHRWERNSGNSGNSGNRYNRGCWRNGSGRKRRRLGRRVGNDSGDDSVGG